MIRFAPSLRRIAFLASVIVAILCLASPAYAESYGYTQYLSDREPSGFSVGYGKLGNDLDCDGGPITLLVNEEEKTYEHGLFAHAPSTLYYTDIQEYGYETFEAWVGIEDNQRTSSAALVEFRVEGDGVVLWESGDMKADTPAQHVSVNISNVKVLKLVVDSRGANSSDHSVWADACFHKQSATPWLYVSDKEFAYPAQVTAENILEGVFARTLSAQPGVTDQPVAGVKGTLRNGKEGNDLSNAVSYTTNYTPGSAGTFSITYSVTDATGLTRTRTAKMTVRGQETYRTNAGIEYLTTPFASFQYMSRDYVDEQGKAAFDLCLNTMLHVGSAEGSYPLETHYGEQVFKVTIDLQGAGIYATKEDAQYLTTMLMDNDPRMFHIKDWGTNVTMSEGMADTVSFYMPIRYGENGYYNQRLLDVEKNASCFLSNIQGGMTDAQRLRAVLYPYADWIKYSGGGQLMDQALADGAGVCGGNARGAIYLAQRMGIKSYWVRTAVHAWSNVKLNDYGDGLYYRVDLLARPGCFISVDEPTGTDPYHGHHPLVWFGRSKGYPDMTQQSYTFAHTAWPNIAMATESTVAIIAPDDVESFDELSLLKSATSIYDGDIRKSVAVNDDGLRASKTDGKHKTGLYTITYSATDSKRNTASAKAYVQVVDGEVEAADEDLTNESTGNTIFAEVGLWGGTEEIKSDGIIQKETGSVTFDVKDRGFTYFDAWVGINENVRADTAYGKKGKVQLEVWASYPDGNGEVQDTRLHTSSVLGWYSEREHILVELPEGTTSVTLKNVPQGSGCNHAAWQNPRFYTTDSLDELPKPVTFAGIEDGATYDGPVTPIIEGSSRARLFRKNLVVSVNPETGAEIASTSTETSEEDLSAITAAVSKVNLDNPEASYANLGDLVENFDLGDTISNKGIYTLVADNTLGQRANASFTIIRDTLVESAVGNAMVDNSPSGADDSLETLSPGPGGSTAGNVSTDNSRTAGDGTGSIGEVLLSGNTNREAFDESLLDVGQDASGGSVESSEDDGDTASGHRNDGGATADTTKGTQAASAENGTAAETGLDEEGNIVAQIDASGNSNIAVDKTVNDTKATSQSSHHVANSVFVAALGIALVAGIALAVVMVLRRRHLL